MTEARSVFGGAHCSSRIALRTVVGIAFLVAAGCATTWQPPVDSNADALRARAVTQRVHDVQVSAAVLSVEDSRRMLGADVLETGVQPIWIEVQNGSQQALWLLRTGVDPDYFSPLEVAWSLHAKFDKETNKRIDDELRALEFANPIAPGATRSGVVFTNPQPKTRVLNVDLVASKLLLPFSLFLPVPGSAGSDIIERLSSLYSDEQVTDYQASDALRAALEKLPCCAGDEQSVAGGEPFNLIIVGDLADIGAAFSRRGFRRDARESDATQRVFGRPPDVVLRKYAQGGTAPLWVRAWLAPMRFQGSPVFLAQIGRARGGRFIARDEASFTLHADVDEARSILIQDMFYSGGLAKLGFIEGVGNVPATTPRVTPQGAFYYTDGLRAVVFFATRPLALSEVELLNWSPYIERREEAAAAQKDAERN